MSAGEKWMVALFLLLAFAGGISLGARGERHQQHISDCPDPYEGR